MKLTQLVLTLILMGGALFVYDAFVVRDAVEPAPTPFREAEPAPEPAELPSFAVLEGRGDEIWRSDVERRLEQLEYLPDVAGRSERAGAATDPAVPGIEAGAETEGEETVDETGDPRPRRFTPKEVATFRALLETVERQRREEKSRRQMRDGLRKLGIELPDAQANQVVDLTLRLYRGFQAKSRDLPKGEPGRDQRLAVFRELREVYADELYGIVPSGDAARIVEAIDRQANRQPKDGR